MSKPNYLSVESMFDHYLQISVSVLYPLTYEQLITNTGHLRKGFSIEHEKER